MKFNSTTLVGRVTDTPQIKTIKSKDGSDFCIATFRLAVDAIHKSETNKHTNYVNISFSGNKAENIQKLLKKGSLTLVEGELNIKSVKNEDNTHTNYTQINGRRFCLMEPKKKVQNDLEEPAKQIPDWAK